MVKHAMYAESLAMEEMAFRAALVTCLAGWAGFIYALVTSERIAVDGFTVPYKHADVLSVIGLLCAAISFACSAYYLKKNIDRVRAWLFSFCCYVPFLGIVSLFKGFGAAQA